MVSFKFRVKLSKFTYMFDLAVKTFLLFLASIFSSTNISLVSEFEIRYLIYSHYSVSSFLTF